MTSLPAADLIAHNRRVTTLDPVRSEVTAIAVSQGKVIATGSDEEILPYRGPATKVIDLDGKRVIPGLNDSHLHLIRGGLNYNLELRWVALVARNRGLQEICSVTRDVF